MNELHNEFIFNEKQMYPAFIGPIALFDGYPSNKFEDIELKVYCDFSCK